MSERFTTVLTVTPALMLAAGSFLRSVPGEWSQGALLAWAAVSLSFLAGQTTTVPASIGLTLAFVAIAVGGLPALVGLCVVYLLALTASLLGVLHIPRAAAAGLALACGLSSLRELVH